MGVATATAIAGVAAAAISTATSISQANKANEARIKAQKQVEAATNEAKKEIERMPMQELSLNLASYEQSREAQQRGIQQVMSQAALDPRQAAAVGGRAMMAGIEGERGIRAEQAKEMFELEKIKATERAEASDKLANLSLAEAEGAQAAAADAAARQRQAQTAAIAAGIEGFGQVADLYSAVQGDFDPENLNMQSQAPPAPSGVSGVQKALQSSNLNSSQSPIQYIDPNTGQVMILDPRGLQLNGRI
jgi:uncharacterized protein YhaN